jgi:hypothetical protein
MTRRHRVIERNNITPFIKTIRTKVVLMPLETLLVLYCDSYFFGIILFSNKRILFVQKILANFVRQQYKDIITATQLPLAKVRFAAVVNILTKQQ